LTIGITVANQRVFSRKHLAHAGCCIGACWFALAQVNALAADVRQCQRVVVSGDPDYRPFSWYDGKTMQGASIEITSKVLDRIKLPYEVRYVGPFARVLLSAKFGDVDIIAELKNKPEREQYLTFSSTAIFTNPIAVFTLKGKEFPYRVWHDLAGKRGGITNGNQFGGGFDEYLAADLNVETATDIKVNFDKLAHNRIDYFVTAYYPGMTYLIEERRLDEFSALQPYVTESANYVGWSKASPCLDRLHDFEAALSDMTRSGETARIVKSYLELWKKRKTVSSLAPSHGEAPASP